MRDAGTVVIPSDNIAGGINAGDHSLIRSRDVDQRNGAAFVDEAMPAAIVGIPPEGNAGGIDAGDVVLAAPATLIGVMVPP